MAGYKAVVQTIVGGVTNTLAVRGTVEIGKTRGLYEITALGQATLPHRTFQFSLHDPVDITLECDYDPTDAAQSNLRTAHGSDAGIVLNFRNKAGTGGTDLFRATFLVSGATWRADVEGGSTQTFVVRLNGAPTIDVL